MRRGEVWWARIDGEQPVVLLSVGAGPDVRALQIVAPATPAERRGFLVLSGEQAADAAVRRDLVAAAGVGVRAVGIEVPFGTTEGLAGDGVVRVALPRNGTIFCTWLVTLTADHLIERAGVLTPAKLHQLAVALELAGVE